MKFLSVIHLPGAVCLCGIAQVTERLRIGTGVTCPIMRIHPPIIAQAAELEVQQLTASES